MGAGPPPRSGREVGARSPRWGHALAREVEGPVPLGARMVGRRARRGARRRASPRNPLQLDSIDGRRYSVADGRAT